MKCDLRASHTPAGGGASSVNGYLGHNWCQPAMHEKTFRAMINPFPDVAGYVAGYIRHETDLL